MILKQQEHIAIVDFARKRIDAALAGKRPAHSSSP
jgi:hypothetical protein